MMDDAAAVAQLLRGRAVDQVWLEVTGRSMAPRIAPPARVRVSAATRPRPGEVWAFVSTAGDVVVHRCAGRRGGSFVFVGDANLGRDELVAPDRLVGRVDMVERNGVRTTTRRRDGLRPLALWAVRALRRWLRSAGDDHTA